MGRKQNLGSECVPDICGSGARTSCRDRPGKVRSDAARKTASSSAEEGAEGQLGPSLLLEAVVGMSNAGTVRELASVLSTSIHPLVPFDIGCIRWAPPECPDDDWSQDPQGEDLTESLVFDHSGREVRGWEGPSLVETLESGNEDDRSEGHSEVIRFRSQDGELLSMKVRSLLVVPLNSRGRMVGALDLMSSRATALPKSAVSELAPVWTVLAGRLGDILEIETLVSERERARTLLDSSDDLLVIWKNKGSVWEVDCNNRTEELMDRGGKGLDRMECPFFTPDGPDMERAEAAWKRAFVRGEPSVVDLKLMDRQGKAKGYLCWFSPFQLDDGTSGVRLTGVDMERIASGIRGVEWESRVNRLLLSVLSNGLKDPLCGVLGYAELLKDRTGLSPEQDRYLSGVSEMARRMNETIDLARLLTRLREGKEPMDYERRDLSRMVQRCLDALLPRTQRFDIIFQRKDSDLELPCSALMERVVQNLVDNAMRFSPSGSRIALDLSTDIEGITFSVRDEGEGVQDRYKRTIFERFWNGPSDDGIKGIGLGLAVSKGIVELHRGRIWVEDSKPRGSVFKFFLPWVPDA